MNKIPKYLIIDVDGVMTTGQFFYDETGKIMKIFGPHDNDGLKIIKKYFKIIFVTADKLGFKISKKRIVDDMGYKLKLLDENKRFLFLEKNYQLKNIIYIGDGIYDSKILSKAKLGICPSNARKEAIKACDYVTPSESGKGAVLDSCLFILKKYYKKEYSSFIKNI